MYAKIVNNAVEKYPYSFRDLKKDHPSTSFPLDIMDRAESQSSYGVVGVVKIAKPSKAGYKYTDGTPTLDGSEWKRTWVEEIKTIDELTSNDLSGEQDPPTRAGYAYEDAPHVLEDGVWKKSWTERELTYEENRLEAYGNPHDQIEFITENGLEAWQAKVAEIKALYPKP